MAVFQNFVSEVFYDLLYHSILYISLDGILIFFKYISTHWQQVLTILQQLRENCCFEKFFGYIIST